MQDTVTVSLLQVQTNKLISNQSHKLITEQTHVQKPVLSNGYSTFNRFYSSSEKHHNRLQPCSDKKKTCSGTPWIQGIKI